MLHFAGVSTAPTPVPLPTPNQPLLPPAPSLFQGVIYDWIKLTAKTVDEDPASCKRWISRERDSVRKARESHLIDKAMTLEPHGLNRRDELL